MTETNEERLENMSPIGVDQEGNLLVKQEDWFWLSEQVQELKKEIERYKKFSGRMQLRNDNLAEGLQDRDEEIAQKNEALAFYADHDNFKTFDSPAIKDCGEKARKSLEGVSHDKTNKT